MVCVEFIYKYIYIYRLLDSYSVYLISQTKEFSFKTRGKQI